MEQNRKYYNCMENAIHEIQRNQIRLKKEDTSIRNRILNSVLTNIQKMVQNQDPMISGSDIFFGGSYFCGTKIRWPDEYDINILMKLPVEAQLAAPKAGFLSVKLMNFDKNMFNGKYGTLGSFLDDSGFILPEKVQSWYKSIIQKSLNNSKDENNAYTIKTRRAGRILVKISESGPAITLHLQNKLNMKIDVDMVPCFSFNISQWTKLYPVQSLGKFNNSDEFFIVPKSPKYKEPKDDCLWKPSFQKEENKLIFSMYYLKPSIKLLKLLREELDHKSIKSYYIKTVVMKMLISGEYPETFWRHNSLSFVFMNVLKYYSSCLEKGVISSIWNENLNLLGDISEDELFNISQRIKDIIKKIDACIKTNKSGVGHVLKGYFGLKINEE